jgi:hypothetical protein
VDEASFQQMKQRLDEQTARSNELADRLDALSDKYDKLLNLQVAADVNDEFRKVRSDENEITQTRGEI